MKLISAYIGLYLMLSVTAGCTYNISIAQTHGAAADIIDESATNTPNVAPTFTVPIIPGAPA